MSEFEEKEESKRELFQPISDESIDELLPDLSFSDVFAGIFASPAETFTEIAKRPLKTSLWLIPMLIVFAVFNISNYVQLQNGNIRSDIISETRLKMEKKYSEFKKAGMNDEQISKQRDLVDKQLEGIGGTFNTVITIVSVFVGGFIVFFILSGFYFLIVKYVFKDNATYVGVLTAYSIASLVSIVTSVLILVVAFITGKYLQEASFGSLYKAFNLYEFHGIMSLVGKINILEFWVYFLFALGMSKLFNGDKKKYLFLVFGVWLCWQVLIYVLFNFVPFFKMFA